MSTRSKFDEYTAYASSSEDSDYVFDDVSKEQIFYSRRNSRGNSISPLRNTVFKPLNPNDEGATAIALDFVVDAFTDLSSKFSSVGYATFDDNQDGQLTAEKAYIDPHGSYFDHMENIMVDFIEKDLSKDKDYEKVRTFEEFTNRFVNYISKIGLPEVYTFSSFVVSHRCSMHSTGTVIELSRTQHDDMDKRVESLGLLEDEEFRLLARKYGFLIPRNSPWCLIANLQSDKMFSYALQYDVLDKNLIYTSYFEECRYSDIDYVKRFLITHYKKFMELFETRQMHILCKNGTLKSILRDMPPPPPDPSLFLDIRFWLPLYYRIKMIEKKIVVSDVLFDMTMNDCYYVLQSEGFAIMHDYAGAKLLKTKTDIYR